MFRDDTKQVRSRLPRAHAVRFNDVFDIVYLQDEVIFITSCGLPLFSAEERRIRCRQWGSFTKNYVYSVHLHECNRIFKRLFAHTV